MSSHHLHFGCVHLVLLTFSDRVELDIGWVIGVDWSN